jgi:hypothetical protein
MKHMILLIMETMKWNPKCIFNHAGIVFRAAVQESVNMTYVTAINPFSAIAFDPSKGVFYTGNAVLSQCTIAPRLKLF